MFPMCGLQYAVSLIEGAFIMTWTCTESTCGGPGKDSLIMGVVMGSKYLRPCLPLSSNL